MVMDPFHAIVTNVLSETKSINVTVLPYSLTIRPVRGTFFYVRREVDLMKTAR